MKSRQVHVSVIVPFFNVEPYLRDAIESVISQTYLSWEMVLVDDGSTDGSRNIAEEYRERFPGQIVCVQHRDRTNQGASASRNLGFQHCSGSYVAYLDSDDMWFRDKLMQQVSLMTQHPDVDMVVGATRYWYSWTGRHEDRHRDVIVHTGGPPDIVHAPRQLTRILYPLGTGTAPSVSGILIKAEALKKVGGWENSFRVAYEDQAFLVKVYLTCSVLISSLCFDAYRQRPGSNTDRELRGSSRLRHKATFYHWLENYMRDAGLRGSLEWTLLQQRLREPELWDSRHRFLALALRPLRRLRHAARIRNRQPVS